MSEVTSTLSASEQAHLDSGGETPIEETPTAEVVNTEPGGEETTEQTQEAEQSEPRAQKVVPLAALHEERAKAKEMREQIRLGNERLNQLAAIVQQRLAPPQPQQQPMEIPSIDVDPVAHFKAKSELLERQIQQLAQPIQRMTQEQAHQQQMQQLGQYVSRQEAEFAQATPDYAEALTHMKQTSFMGLKALGYNDEAAATLASQEFTKLAHNIASQGGNVAATVYEIARSNGYTPKQAQAQADAQTKIQAAQKGVAAAKSLGGGGGVVNGLSLQALAAMSPDEFAQATSGKNEAAWRKLMGG